MGSPGWVLYCSRWQHQSCWEPSYQGSQMWRCRRARSVFGHPMWNFLQCYSLVSILGLKFLVSTKFAEWKSKYLYLCYYYFEKLKLHSTAQAQELCNWPQLAPLNLWLRNYSWWWHWHHLGVQMWALANQNFKLFYSPASKSDQEMWWLATPAGWV